MEAIILAGGMGTRLQGVVKDVPKPMADVNGRPFLSFLMDFLVGFGVESIILSVGYRHEIIVDYFGSSYRGSNVLYAIEKDALGTGGGLREALKYVKGDDAAVLNGDTFFNLNLKKLFEVHVKKGATITMSLKLIENTGRYGTAILDDDRVVGFEEKAVKKSGYINGGVYCVNRRLRDLLDCYKDNEKFSFEKEIIEKTAAGTAPFGFISDGYFIDIGIPEDYERAKRELEALSK